MELRSYQKEQLDYLLQSTENTVIQSPAGTGKSIVIKSYVEKLLEQGTERIAIITPSQELVKNIKDYFGNKATMAFSGETPNIYSPILITTYQSAGKYMKLYNPQHYISDECHQAVCKTWIQVIDSSVRHDGFTATPNRLDGKPLSKAFKRLFVSKPIKWFIDKEYLAPFKLHLCDYPEFSSTTTDNLSNQQEIFGSTPEIKKTVDIFMERSNKKTDKTLFFVTGINHGLLLEEILQSYGVNASFVSSKTPMLERRDVFNAFKSGDKKVLINVELFTTGIDVPACNNVYSCRFTYSPTLHFQIAGRGWRKNGDKIFNYYDLAGNCYYHGSPTLPYPWSLNSVKNLRFSNKESLYYRCYGCRNELILKRLVKEHVLIECPICNYENHLYPTSKLGNVGKEIYEQSFELLGDSYTDHDVVMLSYIISTERSTKLTITEKIAKICECPANKLLKVNPLKRLGMSDIAINILVE